jgi:hypothetical protein
VCEITGAVFQASDLAGVKRREFLGAAREGGALLRDTDGFALTMVPLAQLEAITEIAQVAVAALLALAALGQGSARAADLGRPGTRPGHHPRGRACRLHPLYRTVELTRNPADRTSCPNGSAPRTAGLRYAGKRSAATAAPATASQPTPAR